MNQSISLSQLFEGNEPILGRIMESYGRGTNAKNIALIYVKPILESLEKNADQKMDPLFIAYMCEYAYKQMNKA